MHCSMEIPANAGTCPYCGKDQSRVVGVIKLVFLFLVGGAFLFMAYCTLKM